MKNIIIFIKYLTICKEKILFFTHNCGGGIEKYLREYIEHLDKKQIFVIRGYKQRYILKIEFFYKNEKISVKFPNFILFFLKNIKEINIQSLVGYKTLGKIIEIILKISKKNNANIYFTIHDFHSICPRIHLIDNNKKFCNIPNEATCNRCLKKHRFNNIHKFRKDFAKLLINCHKIYAPSKYAAENIYKIYSNLNLKIEIVPHKVKQLISIEKKNIKNIAFIGHLSYNKGSFVIYEIISHFKEKNIEINWHFFGHIICPKLKSLNFTAISYSSPEELNILCKKNHISSIILPSICPETFSYTLHETISMKLNVFIFNIGAQKEYASSYDKAYICENTKDMIEKIKNLILNFNSV